MAKKIILLLALILFTSLNAEAADDELNFDPIMTTYTDDEPAALTLIRMKEDGSIYFVATDTSANAMAFMQYSRRLYDFYVEPSQSPLIFMMALPAQERGQLDDDLGDWQGNVHVVPIYALFNVADGQIICEKPFYSATGLTPSHYQATIRNPNHTRLVEIFMTHMPRLHERIDKAGISLP